jgi:hypothetical protein
MSSEVEVVQYLTIVAHALRSAENILRPDTEHLRAELRELLTGVDTLFEKIHVEHKLLETREVLRERYPELQDDSITAGPSRT